jgi:hypothetical protein
MPETHPPDSRALYQLALAFAVALGSARPELLAHFTPILQRLQPCRHSPDFATVNWFGVTEHFTPSQAAVVRLLWDAWENGTPAVRQAWLLEQAGSDSSKLSDVFKDNPSWGRTVVPGRQRGTFQLAAPPPDDNAPNTSTI